MLKEIVQHLNEKIKTNRKKKKKETQNVALRPSSVLLVCVDFSIFIFWQKSKTSQPPNHPTQHTTTQHLTTEHTTQPPNTRPNTRPDTEHPNTQHPNTQHPNTRPVTPLEGGAGRPPKGRKGRTPNGRSGVWTAAKGEWGQTTTKRRGQRRTTTEGGGGGGGGANHRRTGRWRECILLSFHSKKGNARAIQRRQRKEAPPIGGGGRQHHQQKEGIAVIRRRHHRPKGGEGEAHLFLLVVLPSYSSLGLGCFSPVPLGGADVHSLPCWVVPFPSFLKKIKRLRLQGLPPK